MSIEHVMILGEVEQRHGFSVCERGRAMLAAVPEGTPPGAIWEQCSRGEWMLWFAAYVGVDDRLLVRAACEILLQAARIPTECTITIELHRLLTALDLIHTVHRWSMSTVDLRDDPVLRLAETFDTSDPHHEDVGWVLESACHLCIVLLAAGDPDRSDTATALHDIASTTFSLSPIPVGRSAAIVREIIPWSAVEAAIET